MNIEIRGLDRLSEKLEKLGSSLEKAAISGMNKTLQDITADAKDSAPVDTGELRDSYEPYYEAHKPQENGGVITGMAGSNCEHAVYVEFGTGPVGETTPAQGKYPGSLSYTQKGWTYYDEKKQQFVHTRGQPAQPTLYPATVAHEKELPENIKKYADEEVKKLTT